MTAGPSPTRLLRLEVEDFLVAYQRRLDDRDFDGWRASFEPTGRYSVITAENARSSGLYVLKDVGEEALKERQAFVMGYWQVPARSVLRTVSNVTAHEGDGGAVVARAVFTAFLTQLDGTTALHACGRYDDELVRRADGSLGLLAHDVTIEQGVLPPDFTALL